MLVQNEKIGQKNDLSRTTRGITPTLRLISRMVPATTTPLKAESSQSFCYNFRIENVINITKEENEELAMVLRGTGRDLVDLNSQRSRLQHAIFIQLEADLIIPGNVLVIMNYTVSTITPDGDIQYIYGKKTNMLPSLKSEWR